MFERDELEQVKVQIILLKQELRVLESRLTSLEQSIQTADKLFRQTVSDTDTAKDILQHFDISAIDKEINTDNTFRQTTPDTSIAKDILQDFDISAIDKKINTDNTFRQTTPDTAIAKDTLQDFDISLIDKEINTDNTFRQTVPDTAIAKDIPQHFDISVIDKEINTDNTFRQTIPDADVQNTSQPQEPVHTPVYVTQQKPLENHIKTYTSKNYSQNSDNNAFIDWLTGGNVLLKTGVLVLFLGLAFLLRYVGGAMPMPVRYLAVFAAGVAAAVGGEYLQAKRRDYGLILQGFGFGVMYLTALAAVKLHNILPHNIALILMVISVALMAWRAVVKDAKILAQVAVLGGLFAPVLVSDGTGSHIALFAYLAVLNTGVATIAWFKAWRSMNLIGAIGTFWIALLWSNEYQPHLFANCEFFLIYHWLLYTLVACFFAYRTLEETPLSGELREIPNNATLERIWQTIVAYGSHIKILDSTLLFGTALSTFGLQYAMVEQWHNAAAYSALLWAAVYGALSLYYHRLDSDFSVLKQAFAVLCLLFITLAIPLALEQQWTATAWALEAALVYAFGLTQKQPHVRLGALIVFSLAAINQFNSLNFNYLAEPTLLQGSVIGAIVVVLSGAAMYFLWDKYHRCDSAEWEKNTLSIIAVLTLVNTLTLPLLTLSTLHCIPVLSIMAVAFAALQWKRTQIVFSVFSLISILLSISCIVKNYDAHTIIVLSAIAWVATAYLLHHAAWRREAYPNADSIIDGNATIGLIQLGLGICFAISNLMNLLYSTTSLGEINAWCMAIVIVWLALTLFSSLLKWQMGIYSAILLAWCEAFYIWAFAISYWAKENTQLSGLIILLLSSIIMIYTLFSLPERNKKPPYSLNIASHFILILSYIFIWTLFLYKSNGYFQALRPLETLIVPLLAWLVFTNFSKYLGAIESLYRHQISVILAIYCVLWLIIANFIHPTARVYIPLLNTIEIGSIAVLCQLWLWHDKSLPENYEKEEITRYIFATIALSGLFLISCAVMRFWHYYNGVEWNSKALLSSFGVQATLSIIWAITAIVIMVIANRQQRRNLWITGAILMAIVVGKLFLVELANSGGIERIVSFIAVGLLLLFVGWFAPVPPRE